MKSKKAILESIKGHYAQLQKAAAEAQIYYERYTSEIEEAYNRDVARIQAEHDAQVTQANEAYSAQLNAATESIKAAKQELGVLAAPWDSDLWESFDPADSRGLANETQVPGGVRVGNLDVLAKELPPIPALVPLITKGHLFIVSQGGAKTEALRLLQSVVTRLAVTFPPLTARFTFIDPLHLGNNFPFKLLPESIRGEIVYSEQDEIRAQMQAVTGHLRTVTQVNLARDFKSIEEYNEHAAEISEAYRLLCIADFPTSFDDDSARRLLSIAEKGVPTGVYIVMHIDMDSEMPRNFNMEALLRTGTVIKATADGLTMPLGAITYPLVADDLPQPDLFNQLLAKVAEEEKQRAFTGVPFERVLQSRSDWWAANSKDAIDVPVGLEGRDLLAFWLGKKDGRISSHALVGGKTGSGKSTLFHDLIASLTTTYSPDELELYLIDFKEGVEFKPYADKALPHARVVAIESEREFGLSVLKELGSELERRGLLFKEVNAQDLATYRSRTGESIPRLLMIVDEFQKLFEENDPIKEQASQIVADLARRGRAFGIHMILGTQSFNGVDISKAAKAQFATRVVLQSNIEDVQELLDPKSEADASLLQRPGQLIYNDDGGRHVRNKIGQAAWIPEEELSRLLGEISDLADREQYRRATPQIVFRGNEGSSLADNVQLNLLYDLPDWPSAQQVKTQLGLSDWIVAERPSLAWLGEAIEIKPHTSAAFRKRSRSNLLLVGSDEETVFGMIGGALVSLAAFYEPNDAQFYIMDMSQPDVPWSDACNLFAEYFDFHSIVVEKRRRVGREIDRLSALIEQRREQYNAGQEELGPAVFLVVAGAHRLPELRPIDSRGFRDPSEHARQLIKIITQGPELGVYTLLWYDRVKSFDDSLTRQSLSYFDRRVALSMSSDDSLVLLGESVAGKMQRYRAYYMDIERGLEKFKPYVLPQDAGARRQLFTSYSDRLRRRLE